MTKSLFLEGLESAQRIVNDKGLEELQTLIAELKTKEVEEAIAQHPAIEKR